MIGTKVGAEAADCASSAVVGERRMLVEAPPQGRGGRHASDHAGMSNEKAGENPAHRKSKVSWARLVPPGLVGA